MKIEQYKNDVSSLKLSDSFKQSLKESMAKEFASVAVNETPARPWMKYSKYIATAACLVLIVATIGVVSLMGDNLRVEKSADTAQENSSMAPETFDAKGGDEGVDEAVTDDVDYDVVVEEDVEDDVSVVEEDADDELEVDAAVEDELEEVVEEVDPEIDEMIEEAPAEVYKSVYAPEDYDGEYYAEDYIVGNATSPDYEAVNIAKSFRDLSEYGEEIDDAPVAEEAPADEEEVSEITTDEYDGMSYSELCLNTLQHMDSVNFVKFTVKDVYSADDAVAITGDTSFKNEKTLYEINLTYDYLNSTELDITMLLAGVGTEENQILGRPVMEDGEKYLACLTFDNEYAEMLYELSYQVHRINGLDVAYHLTGGEGIDPGYTNMGMLDLEYEVITTTVNNPALYTHKAAVKELSRYIKRNWTRQEFEFTDFDNLDGSTSETPDGDEDLPIITGDIVEELALELDSSEVTVELEGTAFDPKGFGNEISGKLTNKSYSSTSTSDSSWIEYSGATIKFSSPTTFRGPISEIVLTDGTSLKMEVNGVGIGDTMDELVKAFNVKHSVDGKLSLSIVTSNANGTAYVISIEVVDNVIKQITIK